jgi:phosphoribosylamine---glycine ligase
MGRTARLLPVNIADPRAMLDLARREHVDLTVVGPELPLERGIADLFAQEGQPLVGPSQAAARLETSKVFAKDFMARHAIPTAGYRVLTDADEALRLATTGALGWPLVIKADGLAAGKGVVVAADRNAATDAVRAAMVDRQFGEAGARVVMEEFMEGREASFFVLCDGQTALPLTSAQDHKRIFDDDRGPNTGGMGAFAPSPLVTPEVERQVMQQIVHPVLQGLRREGAEYRGFLYVGLMLTEAGPRVVEFNVRFGDPEAQVVIPMIDGSLAALLQDAASGSLADAQVRFVPDPHVGVVLASAGYPATASTGQVIRGIDEAVRIPGVMVFQAGTALRDGSLVTNGGRVLTVVGRGDRYEDAIARAYDGVARITFEGRQFRRDIGRSALHPPRTLKSSHSGQ